MPENKENNKDQQTEDKQPEKNLDNLSQTHGKVEKFRPTTLDQVWGDRGSWKYNTMDETEYRGIVEGMPKSDLVSHANRIGLIPIDDRTQLIKRLILEFRRHVTAYRSPLVESTKSKPISKEAEKILKEGR
jgi:hypothetical protein